MNVADALQPKNFSAGHVIVQQGDPADGMFFVEDGIAEVHVEQGATGNRMKVCFLLFKGAKIEKLRSLGELMIFTFSMVQKEEREVGFWSKLVRLSII